ncbi:MAG TPA: T9SS type A sorting domain-containing protein [Bacteroides sp.]|nr:T9SS type A sorting domain-containing protein [Bacteroides sp.]
MKKLSLILLLIILAGAGSASAEEEEKYSVGAMSQNWYGEQYTVYFEVEDPYHEATSVEITGPGITGSLSLNYDNNENAWHSWQKEDKLVYLGSSPPTLPLTYTFTIVDPSETTVRTGTVESFVSVYATNLSPSGGETITGPPVFSWTGVGLGPGYEYHVIIFDQEFSPGGSMNFVWADDVGENTSVRYNGPALTPGTKYYYLIDTEHEHGNESFAQESFVYQAWPGSISGTVSYTGTSTGTIYVAAFTDPTFWDSDEDEIAEVELDSPGSYTIKGLADGTYYVASIMATGGPDVAVKLTYPWGVYGTLKDPTHVTITEGSSESGIDITLVDGTKENPNPFIDEDDEDDDEEEGYYVEAESENWSGEQYRVIFYVADPYYEATSVEITGPGITGSLSIDYDNNEKEWNSWHTNKDLYFGSSPPTPPLTYTFTIVDPSGTTVKTDIVESFFSVYPTNLSPSGGETITGRPFFSWTGVGPGYGYEVVLFDQDYLTEGIMSYVWDSDGVGENTSVSYYGPALTPGAKYYYWVETGDGYNNKSHAEESFVFQPWPGSISGTVSYSGASTGPIYVGVSTDPTFSDEPDEPTVVELDSPGSYKISWTGLPDGTYYVASAMATGGDGDIKITDPWGVYGTWENPAPVTITGGSSESGIDINLVDGTEENPNPFIDEDEDEEGPSLGVYPKKVDVVAGDTAKFEAWIKDAEGEDIELAVSWEVSDPGIGSVDENGLFTANAEAEGRVTITATATLGDLVLSGEARVVVTSEAPELEEGVNQIAFFRQFPDGKITKFGSPVTENNTITIGGIPSPMNFLNGMKLYIPDGALDEDITITIKFPKFGKVDPETNEVTFGEKGEDGEEDGEDKKKERKIVSAVTFEVSVDGEVVVGDYVFATPLELTLPYKRGLLDKLGINPLNLGMYFVSDSGEIQDEDGITNVKVDVEKNMITGTVEHFSNIAIAEPPISILVEEDVLPKSFSLSQNYPNPFNPVTTISYHLTIPGQISIKVYDIIGQEIATLVNEFKEPGKYSAVWKPMGLPSGVYFYKMTADGFTETKKMLHLK